MTEEEDTQERGEILLASDARAYAKRGINAARTVARFEELYMAEAAAANPTAGGRHQRRLKN